MIFLGTYSFPTNKIEEWKKCANDIMGNPLPSCIKKWQTFSCTNCEGYKGYNLVFTEKGQAEEGLAEINRLMFPFLQIEGSSWNIEPLLGMTDTMKVLEKK